MGESTGKGIRLDPAESATRTTRQFPVKTNRADVSRHSLPEVEPGGRYRYCRYRRCNCSGWTGMVPRDRIELSTPAFSGLCSAN